MVEHEQDEIAAAYSTPPPHTVSDDKTSNKDFQVQHMAVSNVFFAGCVYFGFCNASSDYA